jgi:uncharacterized protein YdeI (YjbR/CyaY-like superfamily)
MDGRRNNGGNKNAGRKPKSEEKKLIERLDAIIDQEEVVEILHRKIQEGDQRALTLYFNYRYGKPKESVNLTSEGFNINFRDILKFD